jgi:hypothetical protein
MIKLKLFFTKFALLFKVTGIIAAAVPTIYGTDLWLEKHYNSKLIVQQENINDKQELKRIASKLDTMLYVQKIQIDNQSVLSHQINNANDKMDVYGNVLKKHVTESAKSQKDLLQSVKDFGPYWNMNNEKKNNKLNLDTGRLNYSIGLIPLRHMLLTEIR